MAAHDGHDAPASANGRAVRRRQRLRTEHCQYAAAMGEHLPEDRLELGKWRVAQHGELCSKLGDGRRLLAPPASLRHD